MKLLHKWVVVFVILGLATITPTAQATTVFPDFIYSFEGSVGGPVTGPGPGAALVRSPSSPGTESRIFTYYDISGLAGSTIDSATAGFDLIALPPGVGLGLPATIEISPSFAFVAPSSSTTFTDLEALAITEFGVIPPVGSFLSPSVLDAPGFFTLTMTGVLQDAIDAGATFLGFQWAATGAAFPFIPPGTFDAVLATDGGDLTFETTVIPVPAALSLLLTGLLGLGAIGWRGRKAV